MNAGQFQACVAGYTEHLLDMQELAAHQGYWAGYFQSKSPKSLQAIIQEMSNTRRGEFTSSKPDVSKYQDREQRFAKNVSHVEVVKNGQRVTV